MRRIITALLTGLTALLLTSHAPAQQTTWTETWAAGAGAWTQGDWASPVLCSTAGNILHATRTCAQQAFSRMRWSPAAPLTVRGTVRGQPTPGTIYFCGLAVLAYGPGAPLSQQFYGQLAVGRDVPPILQDHTPRLVWFVNETSGTVRQLGPTDANAWQDFTVTWTPARKLGEGAWSGVYNGQAVHAVKGQAPVPLTIDLQGTGGDDTTECQYGPVTVTGTPA